MDLKYRASPGCTPSSSASLRGPLRCLCHRGPGQGQRPAYRPVPAPLAIPRSSQSCPKHRMCTVPEKDTAASCTVHCMQ